MQVKRSKSEEEILSKTFKEDGLDGNMLLKPFITSKTKQKGYEK